MKREITIDDLPAPGEPLTEKIAEENQAILDEEIRERAARIQAKLPRREYWRLYFRFRLLRWRLNRQNYNALISRRWELYQLCTRLKHELKTRRHSKKQLLEKQQQQRQAAREGKHLTAKIDTLKYLVDEFELIAGRLKAHYAVIEWERKEAEDFANFQKESRVWLEQIKSVCRQSARLHHKGVDSKGREFLYIPEIERVIIKDDRVLFQIKTSEQGLIERFFGRWHSALPYDVDIPDLTCEDTLQNLSAGCKRVVTVERSQNGVNLFWCINRMDSPDGIPKKVLYSKVVEWYPIEEHRKTPWPAGVTNDRKVEWYNFEDHPHVLVAGSPGGGKSTHLNGMIATIASMNTPAEVRMVMIDLKGGVEFVHWRELKHLMGNIVKNHNGVLTALQSVREIMENRLQIFEASRVKKLSAYNIHAAEPMPRILVFVDEMATLIGLGELTTDIHTELRVLSSQGRAAGVHLILATQHPSVDVLPGWIKTNMGVRIASKMPTQIASQIILDTGTAALLPVIAGRMVFSIGREEKIAQSAYISDEDIARAVRLSQAMPEAVEPEVQPVSDVVSEPPAEVVPKFGRDELIAIALEKFNGRLTRRIHEHLGNEIVTLRQLRAIIHDIIQHKTIEYQGITYTIGKERTTYFLNLPSGTPEHGNEVFDPPTSDEIRSAESSTNTNRSTEEVAA